MTLPQTRESIDEAAALLALEVPAACRDGMEANLSLLRTHFLVVATALAEDEPPA